MDAESVTKCLCEVIAEVQSTSGLDCPPLSGSTIPAKDVPEFKSEIWPYAISMISSKLSRDIPNETNLFFDDKTKEFLDINTCVDKILCVIEQDEKKAAVNG